MHSPKISIFDLKAMTHAVGTVGVFPIGQVEATAHSLHFQRPMPGHPDLSHQEAHLLPILDLVVTRFTPQPGCPKHSRYYIDIATVQPGLEVWTVRDLYLDVVILPDGTPRLHDVDEYAEAVLEGHLTPDEQRRALLSAERVVNGLFAHGNDLDAWLASLNIYLDWWTPVDA